MPIVELYENRPAELTGVRIHELALQRWLYANFHVVEGYPIPVIFSAPMDAFSHFRELWSRNGANNPFRHLLDAKDADGTPLYEAHPSPPRYPIISVYRKGWRYRVDQNYSYHRWKSISWPTIAGDPARSDLGNVATAFMPMAWNYMFQVDFFCLRPDTMSLFVRHFMRKLYRTGGIPQTWIVSAYPFYGRHMNRLTLDGDVNYVSPEEPQEGSNVEFRVSMNITVEGWEVDWNVQEVPAIWNLVVNAQVPSPVDPEVLQTIYSVTTELRNPDFPEANPNMNARTNVPDY